MVIGYMIIGYMIGYMIMVIGYWLYETQHETFVYKIPIHLMIFYPKPKTSSTLRINTQSTELKAIWISSDKTAPGTLWWFA